MIPVLVQTTAVCAVCGQVACDLLWVEEDDEVHGCIEGDTVCRDCAPEDWRRAKKPSRPRQGRRAAKVAS